MGQISKKQQAKLRAYKKAKIERAEELKEEGKWVCIFTGQPIPDYLTGDKVRCHHLKGRDGDLITDKKFLTFYIDENYHTGNEGYHNTPVYDKNFPEKSLCNKWWWSGFMSRVRDIDVNVWYNLQLKCDYKR